MDVVNVVNLELKTRENDFLKQISNDSAMTCSTTSSLASPVDSGVQMDSESSEITSFMSNSGYGSEVLPEKEKLKGDNPFEKEKTYNQNDIVNQNISMSVPNYFDRFDKWEKCKKNIMNKSLSDDVFEMEHPIHQQQQQNNKQDDLMNISLNSYELLDYTLQNKELSPEANDQMHVSMSEEVNENLKVSLGQVDNVILPIVEDVPNEVIKPVEEQIVFRRQRKKKSKSDTPKKRVSFHEDILNSTKIDDVHINHGFVTIEPDVSLSFFQKGFLKKCDVVKGRYSWAAEGDAPYYEKKTERAVQSDIYVQNARFSSTSSSSTGSSSSSIDEEEGEEVVKKEPTFSQPKSSCLKKTERKKIDTNIVEEEINRKKRSESNLLDSNIFGSLKNILNFSTSVPLGDRGVPEGQEDFTVYSSSHDGTRRRSFTTVLPIKGFEPIEPAILAPTSKIIDTKLNLAKNNLKLTQSEGFYPNYPSNQKLPANIVVCDSNVYEHKGISYSYEYDKFQKTFEQENKPKSSTVYQMILKEFNFFRRKAKQPDRHEEFDVIQSEYDEQCEPEEVEEVEVNKPNVEVSNIATKMEWTDSETVTSDMSEGSGRHLNSPKRKLSRTNHYSVTPFKVSLKQEDVEKLKATASTSKSSLINRFLKNVTMKKMVDIKVQSKQKPIHNYLGLRFNRAEYVYRGNDALDKLLEEEVRKGRKSKNEFEASLNRQMVVQFRKEIFRGKSEQLLRTFPVRSSYATNGESKPLLAIVTNTTLYISGTRPNGSYCNHFVLPYTELNTILIGPSAQTIHLSNYDKDMQCIITTGCGDITADFVGQLEMAMRRDANKPKLAAVKQLSMRDMANLRRAIAKQTAVDRDEEYFYYSIVNIQDFNPETHETTPMGPNKEGPLMFKTSEMGSRWETAYFILKAGVLYMLSSASQRVPMRVFPLINGSCQSAQRLFSYPRPYTFQLTVEGRTLLLAAPDEYVCSDWLQCLVHAASGAYSSQKERVQTLSCTLLMTCDHIVAVREAFPCTISSLLPGKKSHQPIKGAQALSCAAIVDLVSFRLPSAEQSWCILEFSCREVHECSGDWILYFSTNTELENFISTLEMLWNYTNEDGDSFPLSTIPETDPLSRKCVDIYTQLKNSWPPNTVHLQFV